MAEDNVTPQSMKALWAVVYQIRDDVKATREDGQATRRHLEGWTDPSGKFQAGLLIQHQQLRDDVDAMKADQAKGGERRWALSAGLIGAVLTKAAEAVVTYFQTKGPHS